MAATPVPYTILVTGTRKLDCRDAYERLLDAFHGDEALVPTHWGRGDRERRPYERGDFLREVTADRPFSQLIIRRSRPPRYLALTSPWWSTQRPGGLSIEFEDASPVYDPERIFAWGSRLADAREVAYGVVHPRWEVSKRTADFHYALRVHGFLQKLGPGPPSARTWFGPHLVELVGRERLENLFAVVRELPCGALEGDLVAEPWQAELQTLVSAQRDARVVLESTGVFNAYAEASRLRRRRAPAWKPVPFRPEVDRPVEG